MKAIIAVVLLVFIIAFANASRYSTRVVQEDAAAVKAYWTEENMRNAIEKELILSGGPIEPLADPIEFSSIDGAEPVATEAVEPEFPEEDPEYASQHDKRYPFPFSEGYAPSYNIYPYSAVGKVFFTSGGLNYVCSAAVIAQNTISTAGHCVYDAANGWVTNFIFVPGFNNGAQPYGQWASFQIFSNSDWTGAASFCRDYATVVLRRNGGVSVGTRTGWFGTLRNAGYAQTWRTLGYPQAAPFDGNWNYFADSYFGVQDTRCGGKCNVGGSCSPGTIGIGSRATGGASGGPWVIGFGGANQVNSVNSYKYTTAQPNAIYGPYFDDTWFNTVYSPAVAISPP